MRSGDEPKHARSALRLRFHLAMFGVVAAVAGAVVVRPVAPAPVVLAFVAVGLLAAFDVVVVTRQMRSGPHYQPGPDVPPYRPVAPFRPTRSGGRPARDPAGEATRRRRYLTLMLICLMLITSAWFWVRLFSTTLAVVMSMVAAVIPPVAVFVANFGVRFPEEEPGDPPPGDDRSPPSPDAGR